MKEKAEVLTMLLNSDKVAPLLAFTHCGMFSDPQVAYKMSEEYINGQGGANPDDDGPTDGADT